MSDDLRTEKEILHEIELDVDRVKTDLEKTTETINRVSDYVWGENQFRSPYGQTTLRGRIGRNVEELLNVKLNQLETKLEYQLSEIELHVKEKPTMSYGEFLIGLGIVLGVFSGLLAWILLT
tara:strand:- start:385 stop:750 length:366 start_codon:yes stop_codon:yes gene_type:complete